MLFVPSNHYHRFLSGQKMTSSNSRCVTFTIEYATTGSCNSFLTSALDMFHQRVLLASFSRPEVQLYATAIGMPSSCFMRKARLLAIWPDFPTITLYINQPYRLGEYRTKLTLCYWRERMILARGWDLDWRCGGSRSQWLHDEEHFRNQLHWWRRRWLTMTAVWTIFFTTELRVGIAQSKFQGREVANDLAIRASWARRKARKFFDDLASGFNWERKNERTINVDTPPGSNPAFAKRRLLYCNWQPPMQLAAHSQCCPFQR